MFNAADFVAIEGSPDHYRAPDGSIYVTRSGQSIANLLQEIAAEPPETPPSPTVSYLQFRALFTADEQAAILTAAQSAHGILDWLLQAAGAGVIELGSPLTAQGLDGLVGAGLLTSERKAQILANQTP